ncbi:MAG: sensor histidine kinase [Thermodesulfobacteriota bacterium]
MNSSPQSRDGRKPLEQEPEKQPSNARLQALFDHLSFPVAFLDTQFNFISVNRAYAIASGRPPEEYPGRNHFELFPNEQHLRIFQQVLDTGEPFHTFEQTFDFHQRPPGTGPLTFWDWDLRPVAGEDGQVQGLVLTLMDITEHKQAREALALLVEELERKNQELQEFASLASHDLQEPLRKVRMFGDRLKDKYGDTLDHAGRDYLRRMNQACRRMAKFIDDLLAYSRVTTQARPFQEVDLNQAAEYARLNLEGRIEESAGMVTIHALPAVEGDFNQMAQLFQNLMSNALKFHREGVAPEVVVQGRITGTNDGDHCEIVIQDNGIGFSPEYSEQIFMPFRRLHGHSEYKGTGIGLALCRKIVDRHGGELSAESEPGIGSRFIITLPLTAARVFPVPAPC